MCVSEETKGKEPMSTPFKKGCAGAGNGGVPSIKGLTLGWNSDAGGKVEEGKRPREPLSLPLIY